MDCLILGDGTDTLSRYVGINYQATQRNIAEKLRPLPKLTLSTKLLLFTRERLSRIPHIVSAPPPHHPSRCIYLVSKSHGVCFMVLVSQGRVLWLTQLTDSNMIVMEHV